MISTKYFVQRAKHIALALIVGAGLAMFVSSVAGTAQVTFADPVASCAPPAVLVVPKDLSPTYCKCPAGQKLVTGTPNTCKSSCPDGYTSGTQHGQTYCNPPQTDVPLGTHYCGDPNKDFVNTSIDLGCKGKGNPILDLAFAAIRFLSYGVGLVIVGSLTYAGIQYTGSRGDPNANAQAVKRIQANVTALLLFVFAYAIVNYIVPGQLLK